MKAILAVTGAVALLATFSAAHAQSAKAWECLAKVDHGVHSAEVFWGRYCATRAEAQASALEHCQRASSSPMSCRIDSCWIGGAN